MSRVIDDFSGEHDFLSNFYFYPMIVKMDIYSNAAMRLAFATLEHAFQASKVLLADHIEQIRTAPTPKEAKKLGRSLPKRPDWDKVKIGVMERLVGIKFHIDAEFYINYGHLPELVRRLRDTGDAELIEGNWWNDTFWGVYDGVGENHLGQILMRKRELNNSILRRFNHRIRAADKLRA